MQRRKLLAAAHTLLEKSAVMGRRQCSVDGPTRYPLADRARIPASGTQSILLGSSRRFWQYGRAEAFLGAAFTVRTGNHDHITIGIAEPNLPMLGCRIEVWFFDDLGPHPTSALHDQIKVVDLEPQ